jgi:hypothetical protein
LVPEQHRYAKRSSFSPLTRERSFFTVAARSFCINHCHD